MQRVVVYILILLAVLPGTVDAARLWSSGAELQLISADFFTLGEFDVDGDYGDQNAISTSIKRSGAASFRANPTNGFSSFHESFGDNGMLGGSDIFTPIYTRFYFYAENLPSENVDIFRLGDYGLSETYGIVYLSSGGTLSWASSTGSSLATSSTALSADTWYRIEVGYDAGTNVTVRINGTEEINTTPGGNVAVGAFGVGACASSFFGVPGISCGSNGSTTVDFYFDDLAVNDTSGSAQTSWPGDGSIIHLNPDAGSCPNVDEPTPDMASTISTLASDNDILDCTMESPASAGLTGTEDITLVQPGAFISLASVSGSATSTMRIKSASGGALTTSAAIGVSTPIATTYFPNLLSPFIVDNYPVTAYTDPTTGIAWTQSGTNSLTNMEVGIQANDANPDVNVTTLWALIEYTEGVPFDGVTFTRDVAISDSATIVGSVSKGSGTFVIDHPLDPKNKLLYHSFVESPDVKNLYDGIAQLNGAGETTITLPSYFLPLNKDFRYLATPIGASMPNLHISIEIRKRWFGLWGKPVFTIAGGVPNGRVSWQVTGNRHDPYIEAHPIYTEVEKTDKTLIKKGQCVFKPLCS